MLDHTTETITWNDASIPMKPMPAQPAESFHIKDPPGIGDMVGQISGDRYKTILEAKYEKADLKKEESRRTTVDPTPYLEPTSNSYGLRLND
eukprot:13225940-Ditylum_brightwellii.AAC.1